MGASNWIYYVPYKSDIVAAFTKLRQQVFDSGNYEHWWESEKQLDILMKEWSRYPDNAICKERLEFWEQFKVHRQMAMERIFDDGGICGTHSILDMLYIITQPRTVKWTTLERERWEAVNRRIEQYIAETGSRPDRETEIKMLREGYQYPEYRTVRPLPNQALEERFGTLTPTHDQVEQEYHDISYEYDEDLQQRNIYTFGSHRWFTSQEGIYFIVYRDGVPDEICFYGCSGD